MSNSIHYVVAVLAAEFDTARDEIVRLAKTGEHTPRRQQAFERALVSAEHIVLLTDADDWRSKARVMRQDRDRARDQAQKHLNEVERDARKLAELPAVPPADINVPRPAHAFRAVVTDPVTGEVITS